MRVWFDTNAIVAEDRYSLDCVGTRRDLSALGVELTAGLHLTLYMDDPSEDGTPELLVVDAIVEEHEGTLVAHVDSTTWRREPDRARAV